MAIVAWKSVVGGTASDFRKGTPMSVDMQHGDLSIRCRVLNRPVTGRFAVAAGVAALAANGLLVSFYAFEAGREPVLAISLGTMNDLGGAVSAGLMAPVVLAFGPRWLRRLGGVAVSILTATGPLLVAGVLPFEVSTPMALTGYLLLAGWMVMLNRRFIAAAPSGLRRFGIVAGSGALVGLSVLGLAALAPQMSAAQVILGVVGAVPTALAILITPVWFIWLGRVLLAHSSVGPPARTAAPASPI